MWTAFVFFGTPAKIYFIEGNSEKDCVQILRNSFGLEGKIEQGVSELYSEESINNLLSLFNITIDVFTNPQVDPLYFIQNKEEKLKEPDKADGQFCKICSNFAGMAIPNQPDGSFLCWSCRDSNGWRFK